MRTPGIVDYRVTPRQSCVPLTKFRANRKWLLTSSACATNSTIRLQRNSSIGCDVHQLLGGLLFSSRYLTKVHSIQKHPQSIAWLRTKLTIIGLTVWNCWIDWSPLTAINIMDHDSILSKVFSPSVNTEFRYLELKVLATLLHYPHFNSASYSFLGLWIHAIQLRTSTNDFSVSVSWVFPNPVCGSYGGTSGAAIGTEMGPGVNGFRKTPNQFFFDIWMFLYNPVIIT